MFGKKKTNNNFQEAEVKSQKVTSAYNPSSNNQTTVIAKDTKIEGKLISSQSIRLDGELVGKLECDKKLVLGNSGVINGEINCKSDSSIGGYVKGDIVSAETLHLLSSARIEGNITAAKIIVESGAGYKGQLNIGSFESK